jgi:hypothetical protein
VSGILKLVLVSLLGLGATGVVVDLGDQPATMSGGATGCCRIQ